MLTPATHSATGSAKLALVPVSRLTLTFQLVPYVGSHVTVRWPTVNQESKSSN